MKKLVLALASAAALAVLGLTACSGGSSADSDSVPQDPATAILGVWGEPDSQGKPSLEFAEDGSFAGTDGCNRLFGTWTVDGERVDLGAMGSTMMYCEGVDDWLNRAVAVTVRGDALVVSDEGGAEIGTLDRQR